LKEEGRKNNRKKKKSQRSDGREEGRKTTLNFSSAGKHPRPQAEPGEKGGPWGKTDNKNVLDTHVEEKKKKASHVCEFQVMGRKKH